VIGMAKVHRTMSFISRVLFYIHELISALKFHSDSNVGKATQGTRADPFEKYLRSTFS
jgi:hypothetical protein